MESRILFMAVNSRSLSYFALFIAIDKLSIWMPKRVRLGIRLEIAIPSVLIFFRRLVCTKWLNNKSKMIYFQIAFWTVNLINATALELSSCGHRTPALRFHQPRRDTGQSNYLKVHFSHHQDALISVEKQIS